VSLREDAANSDVVLGGLNNNDHDESMKEYVDSEIGAWAKS
jgi:hypothetical protein